MGDVNPNEMPMAPKYRRAAVLIDLGVPETFAMQGESQLVKALENLLTLGEGTGPGGCTLLQMVCVTQQPDADAGEAGDYLRLEFPLTAHMPHRGDAIERWLYEAYQAKRRAYAYDDAGVINMLLDQYRMMADAGEVMRGKAT